MTAVTLTQPTIEGLRFLSTIPAKGKRFLSINLAMVDLATMADIAKEFGFKPKVVQIRWMGELQIHALLWEGAIADTPDHLENTWSTLTERLNPDAIRYCAGAWTHEATD